MMFRTGGLGYSWGTEGISFPTNPRRSTGWIDLKITACFPELIFAICSPLLQNETGGKGLNRQVLVITQQTFSFFSCLIPFCRKDLMAECTLPF
jgi:hypothetical protein